MIEDDEDITINQGERKLTYMPWHEHIKDFFISQIKSLILNIVVLFGVFWGVIEAFNFFLPENQLNNGYVLMGILFLCTIGALIHSVFKYKNTVPLGLENEGKKAHKIAFSQKPFWEYALAFELLSQRLNRIDRDLEDILSKRVHVKVSRTLGVTDYIDWMQTRPENLLGLLSVSKQLLIFDLIEAIHANDKNKVDFQNLVRISDLITDAYRSAYEYEIEGREIKVPDGFKVVHEIQSGWASVIRDGFCQMLDILESVASRQKDDFSPLNQTIVFSEPPRIIEFNEELEKISLNPEMSS